VRAQPRSARRATTNLAAGIVAFNLLNEPIPERAKVLALHDAWFDRGLASPANDTTR
jgi:hypothetical protein